MSCWVLPVPVILKVLLSMYQNPGLGRPIDYLPQDFTVCVLSRSVVSDSLRPHGLGPARLLSPWDFPGKNTGVGYYALLQGIFLTQGLNPGFLLCRQILYCLSHQESHFKILSSSLLFLNLSICI